MRRAGLILAAALVLLAGACHRKPVRAVEAPPPPPPMTFAQKTADASVQLTLAAPIANYTGLRAFLYDDAVKELKAFVVQAQNDRAHLAAKGVPVPPYQRTLSWKITAATPTLLSAEQTWFDYTGGAHPNHGAKGLIWDVVRDQEVTRGSLLRPDIDPMALDSYLCDAVKAAKAARPGAVQDPQTWPCPHWADSDFVFAPSTTPDKIGGLTFLFDPYVIGPYVEGEYEVTVPQAQVRWALSPLISDQFAGAPKAAAGGG